MTTMADEGSNVQSLALRSVALERMHQQPAILGSMDDWTGINSAVDRRRVQNRLNQRAYRRYAPF